MPAIYGRSFLTFEQVSIFKKNVVQPFSYQDHPACHITQHVTVQMNENWIHSVALIKIQSWGEKKEKNQLIDWLID